MTSDDFYRCSPPFLTSKKANEIPDALVRLADAIRARPPAETDQLIEQILKAESKLKMGNSNYEVATLFRRIRSGPEHDDESNANSDKLVIDRINFIL